LAAARIIRRGLFGSILTTSATSTVGVPQTALTIFSGNPFIPANLQAVMTANNIASFQLRRVGSLADLGQM